MQPIRKAIQKGFTLVELLIVVIILALLAAIVVPQFASSTDDAKLAALDSTLANMRAAIDIYYQQHGEYPGDLTAVPTQACAGTDGAGAVDTEAAFISQMTYYTDSDGGACSATDAVNHKFGPYIKKGSMPLDPYDGVATLVIVTAGDLDMPADAADPGGWKYDTVTGKFIINKPAYETR